MYSQLGTLAAMSLVHGGAAFRLFGPTVFNYLCGLNAADVIAGISEVPDPLVRESLQQANLKAGILIDCVVDLSLIVH